MSRGCMCKLKCVVVVFLTHCPRYQSLRSQLWKMTTLCGLRFCLHNSSCFLCVRHHSPAGHTQTHMYIMRPYRSIQMTFFLQNTMIYSISVDMHVTFGKEWKETLSTLRFLVLSLVCVSGTCRCFIASLCLSLADKDEEEEEVFLGVDWVAVSGTLLRRQRSMCTTRFRSPRWEWGAALFPRPKGTRV